jgi:hypothetical protein
VARDFSSSKRLELLRPTAAQYSLLYNHHSVPSVSLISQTALPVYSTCLIFVAQCPHPQDYQHSVQPHAIIRITIKTACRQRQHVFCALQRSVTAPFAIPSDHNSICVLQDIQQRLNSFKLIVRFTRNFVLRGISEDDNK